MSKPEAVLIYAGPSVSRDEVMDRVPGAVLKPPARSGDVLSDLHALDPTHLLLIDGEFQQHFSTWLKELVYALQYPSIRGVYGAASVGALRAAALADLGMVGVGQVFRWYDSGEVTGDDEVAVAYSVDAQGAYRSTVPLVNVRASGCTDVELEAAREIHWSQRWPKTLSLACPEVVPIDQKRADALELLETFRDLKPRTDARPQPQHLGGLFLSQLERDRTVDVQGTPVPLARIDAVVALESPQRHQLFWDAQNRSLALHLADAWGVVPTPQEIEEEGTRHFQRSGYESLSGWMKDNAVNESDFYTLMHQNARIAKLHRALTGTQLMCRKTQGVLDYLRTHGLFTAWAEQASQGQESENQGSILDASSPFPAESHWRQEAERSGLPLDGAFPDFLREYGFYSGAEYLLELKRTRKDPTP